MFISAIDMTIVNVALPDIAEELRAGVNDLQWVIDAFLVSFAGLLLVGSGLADRFGRRRIFLAGFTAFAIASLLAAVGAKPLQLIVARALMGASVACVLPPALSLVAVMFPPEERSRALAVWSAVAGLGFALGPPIGGALVDAAGWSAVFLVNVPVAIAAVPLGLAALPESRRPGAPQLDLAGAALSVLALGGIVFALIEGSNIGWTSPAVVGAATVGLAAAAIFFLVELRRASPLFDVRVLARPRLASAGGALFAMYASILGILFLLPQYLQYVQDRPAATAGLVLLPLGAALGVASPCSAVVLRRLGARATVAGGLVGMAAGSAILLSLDPRTSPVLVGAAVAAVGAAFGLCAAPATAVVMDDLPLAKAGDGAAVNQLARQVGGAVGVALVGTIFATVYAEDVRGSVSALPSASRDVAEQSIEGAIRASSALDDGPRDRLLVAADRSFDVAARAGIAVCTLVLLLAAAAALIGLRVQRGGKRLVPEARPAPMAPRAPPVSH